MGNREYTGTPVFSFQKAYMLIGGNILNKDLREIIKNSYSWDNPEIRMLTYNWMQENYGKYEIYKWI